MIPERKFIWVKRTVAPFGYPHAVALNDDGTPHAATCCNLPARGMVGWKGFHRACAECRRFVDFYKVKKGAKR